MADEVVKTAERGKTPHVDIPSRSLSNVRYNKAKRFIEMGSGKNRRELFNLSQAKSYMQTMLVGSGCKQLIEQGKTTSIRGLYYLLKHTIEGTREETFDDQAECDPIIEDVEVTLDALREELHVYASNRGAMVGNIVAQRQRRRDRLHSDGIRRLQHPVDRRAGDRFSSSSCDAKFVLHVEKDTVWRRFNEDKFWRTHNCILTHGNGQPPRGVRRLLNRLHNEMELPVYCLLDNDPWGYYIYSVIKQGSINLAYESQPNGDSRMPGTSDCGARTSSCCELSPSVKIKLNDTGHPAGQADQQIPLVRQQEAVAERDRPDAQERLQARSRSADQQRHQLRHRGIRPRPANRAGFSRLKSPALDGSVWCGTAFRRTGPQLGLSCHGGKPCRPRVRQQGPDPFFLPCHSIV